MNDMLKPCPFCGGEALTISSIHSFKEKKMVGYDYWISCNTCGTRGPRIFTKEDTPKEAAIAWNKRQ